MRIFIAGLGIIFFQLVAFGQSSAFGTNPKGVIKGKVIDNNNGQSMEYVSVSLQNAIDSNIVTGTITDASGQFELNGIEKGRYFLDILFMGYKKTRINNLLIGQNKNIIDLGTIKLQTASVELDAVEISADAPQMEYKLDKKVINVSESLTASGMTAVEVLENAPSVETDIEGNVSIRGSSNFTVLIDGKPTALDGNETLQSMPASSIKSIEIITNPSVKYDPEGVGGIINIITKKTEKKRFTGIFNANGGNGPVYGADLLLNYRLKKFNFFASADYGIRTYPGTMNMDKEVYQRDSAGNLMTTYHTDLVTERDMKRGGLKTNLGFDYYLNDEHTLTISGGYRTRQFGWESNARYHEFTTPETADEYYFNDNNFRIYRDYLIGKASHQFNSTDNRHRLNTYIDFNYEIGTEVNSTYKDSATADWMLVPGYPENTKTDESNVETELEIKTEYTFNINSTDKFEAGYEIEFNTDEKKYQLYENINYSDNYTLVDSFSNNLYFKRNIYAVYAMYAGEKFGFGYQLGTRLEYTDREITQKISDSTNAIQRPDIYPSIHLSRKITKKQQVMASYSRRIHRPRGYYLDPFLYYFDEKNIRTGNPALEPEYINSYELNYQYRFKKSFISLEAYYRETLNKIERVRQLYTDDILIYRFDNVSKDYSLGMETMFNGRITKWWNLNISGNAYQYNIDGTLLEEKVDETTFTYRVHVNSIFAFQHDVKIQLTSMYNGRSVTAQGERDPMFMMNLGARKDFFNKQLSVNLNIRDLLNTSRRGFYAEGEDFYSYNRFDMDGPLVNLAVTYRINNYKPPKQNREMVEMDYDGEGF